MSLSVTANAAQVHVFMYIILSPTPCNLSFKYYLMFRNLPLIADMEATGTRLLLPPKCTLFHTHTHIRIHTKEILSTPLAHNHTSLLLLFSSVRRVAVDIRTLGLLGLRLLLEQQFRTIVYRIIQCQRLRMPHYVELNPADINGTFGSC